MYLLQHRRTFRDSLAAAALAAVAVAALTACDSSTTPSATGDRPELGDTQLKVMTFNIWLGGEVVDFERVVDVIRAGDADIVGLQEAEAHTVEIADRLGWYAEASFFGHVTFGAGGLEPGTYEVVLLTADDQEVSRSRFWVVEPGAVASVSAPASVAAGDDIEVSWADAPARKWDWVGIYDAGEIDLYNGYWAFAYTDASVAGSYTFTADDLGDEMLPAGDYVAVLMSDDGYAILDAQPFTVTP